MKHFKTQNYHKQFYDDVHKRVFVNLGLFCIKAKLIKKKELIALPIWSIAQYLSFLKFCQLLITFAECEIIHISTSRSHSLIPVGKLSVKSLQQSSFFNLLLGTLSIWWFVSTVLPGNSNRGKLRIC